MISTLILFDMLIAGGSAEDGPSGGAFDAELSIEGIADYHNVGSAIIASFISIVYYIDRKEIAKCLKD